METMREIERGWMHSDNEKEAFKQVRGGLTRKVNVSKGAQKGDFIQDGIGLFIPDRRNSLGPITHFLVRSQRLLRGDNVITVGQLYTDIKHLLMFYLTT